MITSDNFVSFIREAIPQFQDYPPNPSQEQCITHSPETPLMIVAGPGSGKTTVLVLRALRLVFVDRFRPEEILITTFTKKAATEINSRLIEWGSSIINYFQNNSSNQTQSFQDWLDSIDINRFITGTLDSICNEVITTVRPGSDTTPVIVEGFVNNAIFRLHGLVATEANDNRELDEYLSNFTFFGNSPTSLKEKLEICRPIIDRFVQDQVNLQTYQQIAEHNGARKAIVRAFESYREYMEKNNQLDYPRLEELFYQRLIQGKLDAGFTSNLKALLVDEYQDTNPLQESIYFEFISRSDASFTIVGDDDQSLYRFRGATVELFRDFIPRFKRVVGKSQEPKIRYLMENYRSTPEIVDFFNDFIISDPNFVPARVHSDKPLIIAQNASNQIPVLGMFRSNPEILAESLVSFLIDVFRGDGHQIDINGQQHTIIGNKNEGDFGDSIFLGHTVNEFTRTGRQRLPFLLRQRLEQYEINVFNPRGRSLRDITVVQQLLGIILECIDPESKRQDELYRPPYDKAEANRYLKRWRETARNFVATKSKPKPTNRTQAFYRRLAIKRGTTPTSMAK